MFYLTEDLVTAAKRSEHFPVGQTTFSDPDDLVAFANEEMQKRIVPFIMSVRQDFFLYYKVSNLVSNLSRYALPERAIGNALKDIFYVPDTSNLQVRYPIPKADLHDMQNWATGGSNPSVHRIEGDEVIVVPTPSNPNASSALMMYAFMRPNKIIPTSNCGKVTAVSQGVSQTTLTVDTDLTLSTLTTVLSSGSLVDVVSGKSPFRLRAYDVSIQSITSTSIILNNVDIQNEASLVTISVGDYVCPAQQTCIPMIIQEIHPVLAELICARVNKAQGALQNYQASMAEVKESLANALHLISNRVEAEVDTIYDPNSILNSIDNSARKFLTR